MLERFFWLLLVAFTLNSESAGVASTSDFALSADVWNSWSECKCIPSFGGECDTYARRWRNMTCVNKTLTSQCPYEVEVCNDICPNNNSSCYWRDWETWGECIFENGETCGSGFKTRFTEECRCDGFHDDVNRLYCGSDYAHVRTCFVPCPDACGGLDTQELKLDEANFGQGGKKIRFSSRNNSVYVSHLNVGMNCTITFYHSEYLVASVSVGAASGSVQISVSHTGAVQPQNVTYAAEVEGLVKLDPPIYSDSFMISSCPPPTPTSDVRFLKYCELSYNDWGEWSLCNSSAHEQCPYNGTKSRERKCMATQQSNQSVKRQPKYCYGFSSASTMCKLPCYGWSSWVNGSCTVNLTHGSLVRNRSRDCVADQQNYMNDSKKCEGTHFEDGLYCNKSRYEVQPWTQWSSWYSMVNGDMTNRSRECMEYFEGFNKSVSFEHCPGISALETIELQPWSNWTNCPESCGTLHNKSMTRNCSLTTTESIQSGLNVTRNFSTNKTLCGELNKTEKCPFIHCTIWTAWSNWTSCNLTFSDLRDNQTRTRQCISNSTSETSEDFTCEGNTTDLKPCQSMDDIYNLTYSRKSCDVECGEGLYHYDEPVCKNMNTSQRASLVFCNVSNTNHSNVEKCQHTERSTCPYFYTRISWSKCTHSHCGRGSQYSTTTCYETYNGVTENVTKLQNCEIVSDHSDMKYCDAIEDCKDEGVWGGWTSTGVCSMTCGGGKQTHRRICVTSSPCIGDQKTKQVDCNTKPCPVDGKLSEWTEWTKCSRSCGNGTRTRTRYCTQHQYGGRDCSASGLNNVTSCNQQNCSGYHMAISGEMNCSDVCADLGLSCVSSLKEDIETIEGFGDTQNCTISVSNESFLPAFKGNSTDCELRMLAWNNHTINCGQAESVPSNWSRICKCISDGDQQYGEWTKWSTCSKSCGGGSRERFRPCQTELCKAEHLLRDIGDCDGSQTCPVDGGWASWSLWSECSVTCGSGRRKRDRKCTNPIPYHGGEVCFGKSIDEEKCGFDVCPIHGQFSDWGKWEPCEVTCGEGQQKRRRACDNPPPDNNGNDCEGKRVEEESCPEQANCFKNVTVDLGINICNIGELTDIHNTNMNGKLQVVRNEIYKQMRRMYDKNPRHRSIVFDVIVHNIKYANDTACDNRLKN